MMTIKRWMPHSEVGTLKGQVDRIFDDFLHDWLATGREGTGELSFTPPVDIKESKDAFHVTVEIPGVKKDDIAVELNDNVLSIKGTRSFEKESDGENFHRVERSYGSFARSFSLPTPVAQDKIEAAFKDGLLSLTLPRSEEAKPKKITIKG